MFYGYSGLVPIRSIIYIYDMINIVVKNNICLAIYICVCVRIHVHIYIYMYMITYVQTRANMDVVN